MTSRVGIENVLMYVLDGLEKISIIVEYEFALKADCIFYLRASFAPVFIHLLPAMASPDRRFTENTTDRPDVNGTRNL